MLKNYIKIAWRNLVNHPTYSLINVFGLALGMAVTIMIGLWVHGELTYDSHFKNKDQIGQFWQSQTFNGSISTGRAIPRPLEFELNNNYSQYFKHVIMSTWTQSRYLSNGENTINKTGNYMQQAGPEMFDVEIIAGERDGLSDIKSIMLSQSTAKALFGDGEALGQIVKVNNRTDMKVTAVYKDFPFNTSLNETQYIMPWDQYVAENEWVQNSVDSWGNNSFQMFAQVNENQTVKSVSDAIAKAKYKAAGEDFQAYDPTLILMPMEDWYLRSLFKNGAQNGGRIQLVWLFGIIGVFVLFLACINFMNLSTARSEKRAKEVGIRKSIGSLRTQLVKQFLSESFMVVILAFVIAIALVLIFLQPFNQLADKQIEFPWSNSIFWLISLAFITLTALISGSYPALYLSSFQPVKVLKGTFKTGKYAALPRKVLVVLQFTVSIALIIGTSMIMRQINHSKNRPIGYDKEGMIQLPVMSNDFLGKSDFMRTQFLNSGAVQEFSTSSSPTTEVYSNRSGFIWEGKQEGFQEDFAWTEVSPEYAKSLGMKVIAGRDLSRDMSTDSNAVLVNKTFVKYIGKTDVIGLQLRDDSDEPRPALTIVGVVDDIITQSPYEPVKQAVYAFDKYDNASYYNLRLNPNKSAKENLAVVESVFKEHFPNLPFEYQFIDDEYGRKFSMEERISSLAGVFTALAILISCLGLFGLASFVAEQRTKEIGVRKVLGASVTNLWAMLSKDFIWLVCISMLIAAPLTYFGMDAFLNRYTYRTNLAWWVFLLAGLGAVVITLLTVSFQAIKAAMSDPVKSLKSE
ncbi:ABC transporter permease [Arcticibacterium luteifluviistationis]|uniref:ABC transporter permease n=1 Tax=Arcticibacterium luteifluviistationis TaxID=1784714 RepID=A0A2Z4GFQ4_9BACT|nr:ABC transporter permease [Arcticibacterium luteifluviistationis]AWW00002.1 ABC transporter permease [Arcticibacterium luteifluviistationis]